MNRKPVDAQQLQDELTLLRVLSGEYEDPLFVRPAGSQDRLLLIRPKVASRVLERRVRGSVSVADEAVAEVLEAETALLAKPMRWQLSDIILRVDGATSVEGRQKILDRMVAIRAEFVGGESFDQVARRESESSTRLRGGNLGMVSLDELSPEVAEIVTGMGEGDLSPVIEIDVGFVLLRCNKVFDAEEPDLELARAKIERRLRGQAATDVWEGLTQRLLAGAKLHVGQDWLKDREAGSAGVAGYEVGGAQRSLTADQLQVFLRTRREGRPLAAIPKEELVAGITERVLLDLREHEAVARGLMDAEIEETIRWKEVELQARTALDVRVDEVVVPPTEEQLMEVYSRRKDKLIEPEMRHLRSVRIDIEDDRPRSFYESVRRLGTRAALGETTLGEVADELGCEIVDQGWLATNDVWRLGRVADDAIKKLKVGGATPAVQEGQKLLIFELVGRREERILSFEETREMLRLEILRRKRLQAEETIRQQILTEQRHESP